MFLFRLALALGRTVAELETTLGSGELSKWYAYYQIEPFGQWRDNYHAAIIATCVANYSGNTKQARQIDEFIYQHIDVVREKETMRTMKWLDAMAVKK